MHKFVSFNQVSIQYFLIIRSNQINTKKRRVNTSNHQKSNFRHSTLREKFQVNQELLNHFWCFYLYPKFKKSYFQASNWKCIKNFLYQIWKFFRTSFANRLAAVARLYKVVFPRCWSPWPCSPWPWRRRSTTSSRSSPPSTSSSRTPTSARRDTTLSEYFYRMFFFIVTASYRLFVRTASPIAYFGYEFLQ